MIKPIHIEDFYFQLEQCAASVDLSQLPLFWQSKRSGTMGNGVGGYYRTVSFWNRMACHPYKT
jgi:hypothetical protein